jgi:hypothetical protein
MTQRELVSDGMILLGLAAIVYGCWLFDPRLGCAVGGGVLTAVGYFVGAAS